MGAAMTVETVICMKTLLKPAFIPRFARALGVVPILMPQQGTRKRTHMLGRMQLVVMGQGQEPTDHDTPCVVHVYKCLHTRPPINDIYSLYR